MRDFSFVQTDQPTMAEFNQRFGGIADFINNLGNEYVWQKDNYSDVYEILYGTTTARRMTTFQTNNQYSMKYYDTVAVVDGELVYSGEHELSYNFYSDLSDFDVLRGKYVAFQYDSKTYKIAADAVFSKEPTEYTWAFYIVVDKSYSLAVKHTVAGSKSFVNSPDSNAYPIDDGFTYTALGQLGNKVQIATGSYTGTGTYGVSNPNSLTFDFTPKTVLFFAEATGTFAATNATHYPMILLWGITIQFGTSSSGTDNYSNVTYSGNTMTWYSLGVGGQFNVSGRTYRYVAIG